MNKQKFDTLQEQLHDHHIKGIDNAFTRSPLFLVQVKRIDWGYEEEYSEEHTIYFDDAYWYTSQEFYDDHSLEEEEELEYFIKGASEAAKRFFRESHKDWNLNRLWEWLDYHLPDNEYCLVHGNSRWETINYFITRKQAENFVESKSGKGNPNVRIYVDSLYRSNEFEILLEAIARGELVLSGSSLNTRHGVELVVVNDDRTSPNRS